jgi:glycosyltransferase involved in cell wall biosynthesis
MKLCGSASSGTDPVEEDISRSMSIRVDGRPVVSIIIPCYNTAQYLGEAIASALAQTFSEFELLIIDDGSTDSTPEIASCFLSDSRVRYIRQDNMGLSAARNKGIELSQGEFIALLDADDIWDPEKLKSQLDAFDNMPDCGLVFTDYSTFDEYGIIASEKNSVILETLNLLDFDTLYCRNNFIYPSTVMIRRGLFETVGDFDVTLKSAEDYDMWLRIAKASRLAGIGSRLVRIRQHGSNMSLNIPRMLENEIAVIEKNRSSVHVRIVRKRHAKIYYLNADRFVHAGKRLDALRLLARGISLCPYLYIDIAVVLIKLILGGQRVEKFRRYLNDNDTFVAKYYWSIYSRY